MRSDPFHRVAVTTAAVAVLASSSAGSVSARADEAHVAREAHMTTMTLEIPKAIQVEHEEIHATLVEATKAPGRVGAAARELAQVLHPHFVREEEIALPPLGLLAPLAAGDEVPEPARVRALEMADALKRVAGAAAYDRIKWQIDPRIQKIVATWPGRLDSRRARTMGFESDRSMDAIIQAFIEDDLPADAR